LEGTMKHSFARSFSAVILLVFIPFAANSQDKYVPQPNEELYGTWTNDVKIPHKRIVTADGIKRYLNTSDTTPMYEESLTIDKKWVDADGSIWYKTYGKQTAGPHVGSHWLGLEKISKDGSVYESTWVWTGQNEFDPNNYPSKIDPNEPEAYIYHRMKQ